TSVRSRRLWRFPLFWCERRRELRYALRSHCLLAPPGLRLLIQDRKLHGPSRYLRSQIVQELQTRHGLRGPLGGNADKQRFDECDGCGMQAEAVGLSPFHRKNEVDSLAQHAPQRVSEQNRAQVELICPIEQSR